MTRLLRALALLAGLAVPAMAGPYFTSPVTSTGTGTAWQAVNGQFYVGSSSVSYSTANPQNGSTWTITLNGTNGNVTATKFNGSGAGLTGVPSASAVPSTGVQNGALNPGVTVSTANIVPGFNGNSQLVQMSGAGAYPAASGAALTSLTAANIAGGTMGSGVIPTNAAGGVLAGSYPYPTLGPGVVLSTHIGNSGVTAGNYTVGLNIAPQFSVNAAGQVTGVTYGNISLTDLVSHTFSTAVINSGGKFSDDKVGISTGGITGGFNGNSQLVQLSGAGAYPAANGAAITSLTGANVTGTVPSATNIAAGAIGQLPYQSGAGVTAFLPSMAAAGIIVGNGSGVVPTTATLTGTANQVIVTQTPTAVTLSLPQSINSGATPTLTGTNFTGIPESGVTGLTTDLAARASTGTSVAFSTIVITQDGASAVAIPNTPIYAVGSPNADYQLTVQNKNNGASADAGFLALADNGTNSTNYQFCGVNGSGYVGGTNGWFDGPDDGTCYAQTGNFSIGAVGSGKAVNFFAGGTAASNVVAVMTSTGMQVYPSQFSVGVTSFVVAGGTATVGNALVANYLVSKTEAVILGTATVSGNAMSVGGSTWSVVGGTVTTAYRELAQSFMTTGVSTFSIISSSGLQFVTPTTGITWADGTKSTTAFTIYGSSCIEVNNLPAGSSSASTFITGSAISSTLTFTNPSGYPVTISMGVNASNGTAAGNCVVAPLIDSTYTDLANPQAGILNSFPSAGYGPMSYPPREVPLGTGNHTMSWMIRNTGSGTCSTFNDGNNQNWMRVCRLLAEPW
jgi:hypothetical protein